MPRRLGAWAPWGVALLCAAMIALATLGVELLFPLLSLFSLHIETDGAAIRGIILLLVDAGLCLLIAGLVLALARSRNPPLADRQWLALLCLGPSPKAKTLRGSRNNTENGPLFAIVAPPSSA